MKIFKQLILMISLLPLTGCSEMASVVGLDIAPDKADSEPVVALTTDSPQDSRPTAGLGALSAYSAAKPLQQQVAATGTAVTSEKANAEMKPLSPSSAQAGLIALSPDKNIRGSQVVSIQRPIVNGTPASAGLDSISGKTAGKIPTQQAQQVSGDQSQIHQKAGPQSCFEVRWLAATTAVEIYHIKFGPTEYELNGELSIPVNLLTKVDDPALGPSYAYKLLCDSPLTTIFIQISSENKFGKSPYSAPVKISR